MKRQFIHVPLALIARWASTIPNVHMAQVLAGMNASSRDDAFRFRLMKSRIDILPLVVKVAIDMFAVKTLKEQERIWRNRAYELAEALGVSIADTFSAQPSVSSSSLNDPIRTAEVVSLVLKGANVPHAIGGALALGVWSEPRGTFDVNLNIWPSDDAHLRTALQALVQAGLAINPKQVQERCSVVITLWHGLVRVELYPPRHRIQYRAKDDITHSSLRSDGPAIPILSAESLALMKMLLFRCQDKVDVERMVEVNTDLHHARVRAALVELFGEDSERLWFWNRTVAPPRD
jgi:hypothetical protein